MVHVQNVRNNGIGGNNGHTNPQLRQIFELIYNGRAVGTVTLRQDLPRHGSIDPNNVVCTLLELYQSIPCDIPLIKTHSIAGWVFLNEVEPGNLIVWGRNDMHLLVDPMDISAPQEQGALLGGVGYSQWAELEEVAGVGENIERSGNPHSTNHMGDLGGHGLISHVGQHRSDGIFTLTRFDSAPPSIIEFQTPEHTKDYIQRVYAFQQHIGIVCLKTKDYKGKVTRIDFGCEFYGTRAGKNMTPSESSPGSGTTTGDSDEHRRRSTHHLGSGTRRCPFFIRYRYRSSKDNYYLDEGCSTLIHDHECVDVWNYNTNKRLLIKEYKKQLVQLMMSGENISSGDIIGILVSEASKDDLYKGYFSSNTRKKEFAKAMRKNCEYFRRSFLDKRSYDYQIS
ncbi:HCL114Cp [Eremothecium sinecaudum]|uniref:HCL114Cp n=1 Tax=Eremothecium sinecaudum TaxID=45286 RepID=A0A0X8HRD5_9SACH|nr:HCL114Cp [Eremothecium sinecaudum]AMD20037.1 HCL114Cp [Eremothecium sinecaudum]